MENIHFDRNATHSLALVALVVIFEEELGKEGLKKIESVGPSMSESFPQREEKHSINFSVGDGPNAAPAPKFAGWKLSIPSELDDQLPDWQLEIDPERCVLRTFAYSTWKEFIGQATAFLEELFQKADLTATPIQEVGVQFVDRFHWTMKGEEYSLGKIFNPESPLFSESIKKQGSPLWHLFQGWKKEADERAYIENINVSTTHTEGEELHRNDIVHVMRCIQGKPTESNCFNTPALREIAQFAHDENKKILNNLLSEKAIKRIRLNE